MKRAERSCLKCSKCGQEMQTAKKIPVELMLRFRLETKDIEFTDYNWQFGRCSQPGHGVEVRGTPREKPHA